MAKKPSKPKASSATETTPAPKTWTRGDGYQVDLAECHQVFHKATKQYELVQNDGGSVAHALAKWEGVPLRKGA